MKEYKSDCPGCGRICTLTLKEKDNKYYLKGNSCDSGRHGAIKKWSFVTEENLISEDKKKKENKRGFFNNFVKLIGVKR